VGARKLISSLIGAMKIAVSSAYRDVRIVALFHGSFECDLDRLLCREYDVEDQQPRCGISSFAQ
jgi:hypothetical protein